MNFKKGNVTFGILAVFLMIAVVGIGVVTIREKKLVGSQAMETDSGGGSSTPPPTPVPPPPPSVNPPPPPVGDQESTSGASDAQDRACGNRECGKSGQFNCGSCASGETCSSGTCGQTQTQGLAVSAPKNTTETTFKGVPIQVAVGAQDQALLGAQEKLDQQQESISMLVSIMKFTHDEAVQVINNLPH